MANGRGRPEVLLRPCGRLSGFHGAPSQDAESGHGILKTLLDTARIVAGLEKKAVGLEILDVSGKVDYADFLVLMTGRSDRQVAALELIRDAMETPVEIEFAVNLDGDPENGKPTFMARADIAQVAAYFID